MVSEAHKFQRGIWVTLLFTFLLWIIKAIEVAFEIDFTEFGILPRHLYGMFGIITGPLVHGDIFHLISNTFPLIILGVGLFYFYHRIAFEVIFIIYLMTLATSSPVSSFMKCTVPSSSNSPQCAASAGKQTESSESVRDQRRSPVVKSQSISCCGKD